MTPFFWPAALLLIVTAFLAIYVLFLIAQLDCKRKEWLADQIEVSKSLKRRSDYNPHFLNGCPHPRYDGVSKQLRYIGQHGEFDLYIGNIERMDGLPWHSIAAYDAKGNRRWHALTTSGIAHLKYHQSCLASHVALKAGYEFATLETRLLPRFGRPNLDGKGFIKFWWLCQAAAADMWLVGKEKDDPDTAHLVMNYEEGNHKVCMTLSVLDARYELDEGKSNPYRFFWQKAYKTAHEDMGLI